MTTPVARRRGFVVRKADVDLCPHRILAVDHWREDGTCRCDEPNDLRLAFRRLLLRKRGPS